MDRDYAEVIGKLLDKAQRTESEGEREALLSKVADLMAKHSIDEAMVSAKRRAEGRIHEDDELIRVVITYYGQYAQALQYWTHTIGDVFGCKTYWSGNKRKRTVRGTFLYGYRADVEQVQMLIESLQLQLVRPLKDFQRSQKGRYFDTTVGAFIERRSFVQGFADGAAAQIHRTRHALAAGAGTGTELVLVDRKAAVDKFAGSASGGSGRGITGSNTGYSAGRTAGAQANVTTSRGSSQKAIG